MVHDGPATYLILAVIAIAGARAGAELGGSDVGQTDDALGRGTLDRAAADDHGVAREHTLHHTLLPLLCHGCRYEGGSTGQTCVGVVLFFGTHEAWHKTVH